MAAAISGGLARRMLGTFRTLLYPVRSLSAAAESSAPAAAEAGTVKGKPKRKKPNNLFDVLKFLPDWGLGYQVAKTNWQTLSYQLTSINLYKDGRHGKAWGIRFKDGVQVEEAPVKMSGVNKRGWKYIKEAPKKANNDPPTPQQKDKHLPKAEECVAA